ncbi:MAG: efflux RND transporter periplasmic adaptor subunit [Bacteroidetes bacterium]|nr:efflux RND transporter periplasmic adaptor subunit [Bacteroidota bacterium]MBS1974702.1 efflux RND transporter periplasmic adaptor subunit [Bacteroidota bacterium]
MKNIILISIILISVSACRNKNKIEEPIVEQASTSIITLTNAQIKSAAIVTGKLEQKAISSILKVNGKIDVPPQNLVSISVPLGGYLKSTRLLPGMHINKGDVIAVIEDQQYIQMQQDFLTAQAKINFLQQEYERQKELNKSKASSDKAYQQAEADYKSQKVLIAALSEKLQLAGINLQQLNDSCIQRSISIHSPINGYVSKVNVNIGKYVAPTDVLFELINPTDIHLALKIFEKDLNKLYIGQKLVAYTNNQPDKKYPCEILLIGKDLSPERNTDVHCHFEAYDKTLVPGTYMNADIQVRNYRTLVLPDDAIVMFENKMYVFIAKGNNEFEMKEIKTGISEKGYTEILGADNISDQGFVIKGAYSILMKIKNTTD